MSGNGKRPNDGRMTRGRENKLSRGDGDEDTSMADARSAQPPTEGSPVHEEGEGAVIKGEDSVDNMEDGFPLPNTAPQAHPALAFPPVGPHLRAGQAQGPQAAVPPPQLGQLQAAQPQLHHPRTTEQIQDHLVGIVQQQAEYIRQRDEQHEADLETIERLTRRAKEASSDMQTETKKVKHLELKLNDTHRKNIEETEVLKAKNHKYLEEKDEVVNKATPDLMKMAELESRVLTLTGENGLLTARTQQQDRQITNQMSRMSDLDGRLSNTREENRGLRNQLEERDSENASLQAIIDEFARNAQSAASRAVRGGGQDPRGGARGDARGCGGGRRGGNNGQNGYGGAGRGRGRH